MTPLTFNLDFPSVPLALMDHGSEPQNFLPKLLYTAAEVLTFSCSLRHSSLRPCFMVLLIHQLSKIR